MHIPLEMMRVIVSSSTYNFNEFKTYLSFAFITSGNCKLNKNIKNEVCNHLSISQRTLDKHIKSLIIKGYFGYNPKTNTLFINGLNKIKRLVYKSNDYNERILKKTSFVLNAYDFDKLKFLTFSAIEQLILKHQSIKKDSLKFNDYLKLNNLSERYKLGSESVKKNLKRNYNIQKKKAKGDSMKKENPNHFGLNLFEDDKDYLGVSNSFISDNFNRTKSWGCKMKQKSSTLSLLDYSKMFKYIDSYPVTFNVRKYLSITNPIKYCRYVTKRQDNMILVFETGYDKIKSNVNLTRRR